jgi:hypothetical protein
MSVESKIMGKVANLVNFIKEQTRNDLMETNTRENLGIDIKTLEKLSRAMDDSISSSFVLGSNEVTSVLKEINTQLDKSKTKKTAKRKTK